jgi:hypothetical protein
MKGSPLRDAILILLGAVLVLIPLRLLTRTVPVPHDHVHAEPTENAVTSEVEAWIDLRFSHAPEELRISQNGTVLFEGGGELREDADIVLTLSDARNALDLEFRWSEDVEQAYVELTLEAEGLPIRELGFWSKGEEKRRWILEWEEGL